MMFNWACKLLKFLIVLTTNKMFIRRGGGVGVKIKLQLSVNVRGWWPGSAVWPAVCLVSPSSPASQLLSNRASNEGSGKFSQSRIRSLN